MADSIQSKRNQQTYLRQVQQEKALRKREIMQAQKNDIQAVRDYYKQQSVDLEADSAAAVNHIKDESRRIAQAEREERSEKLQSQAEAKRAEREARTGTYSSDASAASAEKKNFRAQNSPLIQNYETRETDNFYRVQNRGSRVSEDNGSYIIEAYAPEHEKNNLRVSIQRNKAIVSGQRKYADEAQDGNKTMRTNNFQSFREEFAFDRPVSTAGMTRERVGDFVRFYIPKLEAVESPEDEA